MMLFEEVVRLVVSRKLIAVGFQSDLCCIVMKTYPSKEETDRIIQACWGVRDKFPVPDGTFDLVIRFCIHALGKTTFRTVQRPTGYSNPTFYVYHYRWNYIARATSVHGDG
jgi:hypothetical protein